MTVMHILAGSTIDPGAMRGAGVLLLVIGVIGLLSSLKSKK